MPSDATKHSALPPSMRMNDRLGARRQGAIKAAEMDADGIVEAFLAVEPMVADIRRPGLAVTTLYPVRRPHTIALTMPPAAEHASREFGRNHRSRLSCPVFSPYDLTALFRCDTVDKANETNWEVRQ